MLQRILAISTLALAAFAAAGPAHGDGLVAATAPPPVRMQYGAVAIEASIGVMQGEANEYVYRPDHTTVSQLVWAFDNDVVFNGGIAVMPLDWLALGIRARTNISDPTAIPTTTTRALPRTCPSTPNSRRRSTRIAGSPSKRSRLQARQPVVAGHWRVRQPHHVCAGSACHQWDLAKGPSTNFDYTTGVTEFNGGNATGGQSISQTFSLGAELDY